MHLTETVPYRIHTILIDNGLQSAKQPRNLNTIYSRPMQFGMICAAKSIELRLTKPNQPWTNGQVEHMNRAIKNATAKGITAKPTTSFARTWATSSMPTTTRAV